MSSNSSLRVLGIDAVTGRPLDPLPFSEAQEWAQRILRRGHDPRYGVVSGDLSSAGWGVVFPTGIDREVQEALKPLLERRRFQAGDLYQEFRLLPGEGATNFRSRLRSGLGRVDPRTIPWYLLVVGDPKDIPFDFEFDMGFPHAVGRLALESPEDLAAYARRLVDLESEPKDARGRVPRCAVFAPTHPDDPPTEACVEHLASPLAEQLVHRSALQSVLGESASREKFLELAQSELDLLVVAGHAIRFPADHRAQRRRQGAIICSDWPGRERWSGGIPPEHTVAAEDLPPGVLDKSIVVLFGCYSAGTPRLDRFDSLDPEEARELTSEPFASAVGTRLLGREGGAVAVVGHVGRAFEASFFWRGSRQIVAFEDAVAALLDGREAGEGLAQGILGGALLPDAVVAVGFHGGSTLYQCNSTLIH